MWLSEKQGKAFGDLTDADARSRFKKFLKKWNAGQSPLPLALAQYFWAHQFSEPVLFPSSKLTDLHLMPGMSI